MQRFSTLLFLVSISTPLLAQSILDRQQTLDVIAISKYCANVEDYSHSEVPLIFARITSAYGLSAGWAGFDNRAAWSRAGRPKPVALVWHRDTRIVRVSISAKNTESPRVYADYCYRPDGALARFRSVPSERQNCEAGRDQCTYLLREVRFYPPGRPVLKDYGADGNELLDMLNGATQPIMQAPPAERMIQAFVPMKWPEYLHVSDLPFSGLLYAALR